MSTENNAEPKCVLCCNYFDRGRQQRLLTPSVSIISCAKHIPNDICQTVYWSQFDDSNNVSSLFCEKCYDIVGRLSKFDQDLEEIQKQISELVNLLVLHVKEQRLRHGGNTTSKSFILDADTGMDCENVSQSISMDPIVREPNCSVNNYDEVEDLADSLDSSNTEYENPNEEIDQLGDINTNFVSQSNESSLKPFVKPPEHVKPKSGLQKVLEGSSGYPCPTCHKKFSRYTIMKKHDCSKPTVECETCGMSFSSGGVLKIHIRSHTGEKPYKCETCGKAFSIKANLREHMNLHTGERNFECDICQKTFKTGTALITHKSRMHIRVEDKMFKCDVCSKDFIDLKTLKVHMIQHSSGTSNPFKCDICEKSFPSSICVIRHIERVHSQKERRYKCDKCEKLYFSKYQLKNHMLRHNAERFQCSYCEKKFKSEGYLKMHESAHTEKGTFDCKTCGKSFKSTFHLRYHMRFHKERQICEFCGKSIASNNMRAHIKWVHEGKKIEKRPRFACKICDATFTYKQRFVRHNEAFCHICCQLFGLKGYTLLDHQIEKHTVKTQLHCDNGDPTGGTNENVSETNAGRETFSNLPNRRSRSQSQKKINYNESSSEDISENTDSDRSNERKKIVPYEEFKVEVKTEDEFSEIEDDFSEVDDF